MMAAPSSRLELCTVLRKEFLSCNICQEKTRDLRSLPCSHRFCVSCLQAYVISTLTKKNIFPCPTCHADTTLPKGGVQTFPKNKTLLQLDDVISREEKRGIECQDHHGNEVISFCVTCWDPLCLRCLTEKPQTTGDKHKDHQFEGLSQACQSAIKGYEVEKSAFNEKKKNVIAINGAIDGYLQQLEAQKMKNLEDLRAREQELHDIVGKWSEERKVGLQKQYADKQDEMHNRQTKVNETAENIEQLVLSVTEIIGNLHKGETRGILEMNAIAEQARSNEELEAIQPLAQFAPFEVNLKTDADTSIDSTDLYGSGSADAMSSIFGHWQVIGPSEKDSAQAPVKKDTE